MFTISCHLPNDIVTTNLGNLLLPKTPELFAYDLDGNMTSDGLWTNTWDAENRLIKSESLSSAPTASKRKVTYEYDYRNRMIRRTDQKAVKIRAARPGP